MKILLSAIACNPVTGSDAYFGWSAVRAIASLGEVHVLTHGFSRPFISENDESALPNVKFHFIGQPTVASRNGLVARVQSWKGCRIWQNELVLPYARRLHSREGFDIAHHVTISSWRLASPLWKLGIPLVWGPIGGGEEVPPAFRRLLSPATRFFEIFRRCTTACSMRSPQLINCSRGAAFSIAANNETSELLHKLGCSPVEVHSPAFFAKDRLARFAEQLRWKDWSGPLQIFSGGNLEGRKGVALSLRALAVLKNQNIPFQYLVAGGGAESNYLKNLARRLGLRSAEVVFGDGLVDEAYDLALRRSHVYLLPSLRENAGLTMMEAMLAGCVPVVLKLGGPGEIVTDKCGFPVPTDHPDSVIKKIAASLLELHRDRVLLRTLGEAASNRILTSYSEEAYLAQISRIYAMALEK